MYVYLVIEYDLGEEFIHAAYFSEEKAKEHVAEKEVLTKGSPYTPYSVFEVKEVEVLDAE